MLSSKKLTFSLTSIISANRLRARLLRTLLLFADGRDDDNKGRIFDLGVTISAAESMIDVDRLKATAGKGHPDQQRVGIVPIALWMLLVPMPALTCHHACWSNSPTCRQPRRARR